MSLKTIKIISASFLLFCLFISVIALVWDCESISTRNSWSESKNGIQVMVFLTRTISKANQHCRIVLKLRNSGTYRQLVSSHIYVTDKVEINGRLSSERIGDVELGKLKNIILEPNQVIEILNYDTCSNQIGMHTYSAHLSLDGGINSNSINMYVIPGNKFWIVMIVLELAALFMMLWCRKPVANKCILDL
jgi:hypothetical protein